MTVIVFLVRLKWIHTASVSLQYLTSIFRFKMDNIGSNHVASDFIPVWHQYFTDYVQFRSLNSVFTLSFHSNVTMMYL